MNPKVKAKYSSYPPKVKPELQKLRKLILDIALKDKDIDLIDEDLKWGEPSFITKTSGSTLRIDWKQKRPESISLFFNCRTKLISMFKEIYPDDFNYIGEREIRLPLAKKYPIKKLSKCIEMTLKYNHIKNNF
jgi:hypothetical protein